MRFFAISTLSLDALEMKADHGAFVPCVARDYPRGFCIAIYPVASSACHWVTVRPAGEHIAISETLARKLHPALFDELATPFVAPNAALA